MFWNLNFTIIPAIHVIKISYHQRKVLPKNFRKTFWPNSFFGLHFLHLIIWLMELWLNNHCQYNTPACQNKLMKISLILLAYKLTLWIRKNRTIPNIPPLFCQWVDQCCDGEWLLTLLSWVSMCDTGSWLNTGRHKRGR